MMTAGSSSPTCTSGSATSSVAATNGAITDMSATSTFGSQSAMPKSSSSRDHHALSPTAMAPSDTVAQNVTTHSIEWVFTRRYTLSPGATPFGSDPWRSRDELD